MALFAISDVHLSLGTDKPMDVFSGNWEGYIDKLRNMWLNTITENDTVIIPGDISWAMYLENAVQDFTFLSNLPGRKIISKGNHDYWWETASKMQKFLDDNHFKNIFFLHNNFYEYEDWAICGTKGWPCYETQPSSNKKMFEREMGRLELSLKMAKQAGKEKIIAVLHFPPFGCTEYGFIDLMKKYGVHSCIYGHLHSDFSMARQGLIEGIEFRFVSADYLDFRPEKLV